MCQDLLDVKVKEFRVDIIFRAKETERVPGKNESGEWPALSALHSPLSFLCPGREGYRTN